VIPPQVFLGVCSDGWADRPDVVEGIEDQIVGGLSMKLYSPEIRDFDEYYFRLGPYSNRRNPWFREFWQERFHCYIDGVDRDPRYTKSCTGQSVSVCLCVCVRVYVCMYVRVYLCVYVSL